MVTILTRPPNGGLVEKVLPCENATGYTNGYDSFLTARQPRGEVCGLDSVNPGFHALYPPQAGNGLACLYPSGP